MAELKELIQKILTETGEDEKNKGNSRLVRAEKGEGS